MLRNKLHHHSNLFCRFICFSLSLVLVTGVSAEDTANPDELENVRSRIDAVQSDLQSAKSESEKLQEELQETEVAASELSTRLVELENEIQKRDERMYKLNDVIAAHEQTLNAERSTLARHVRSAFMAGRNDYLKLLLNQEDPARVGRVLAYYDYSSRSRIETINTIKDKVDLVNELKSSLVSETEQLEQLKLRHLAKREELAEQRESRNDILKRLQNEISAKGDELNSLQEHERKLSKLLDDLDEDSGNVPFYEDIEPFGRLQGKLSWPTEGRLLHTFGSTRRGNSLKWQGVKIGATAGAEVRAVYTGRVIFADWFRNLGQLIILDHGDGYMTLYGYNQNLLKKAGDWVLGGETIAHVGDTGGQGTPGVYFEIRHRGKAQNPTLWCKR